MSGMIINDINNFKADKRKNVRILKRLAAKYKDAKCSVLNVSDKGVLLETGLPVHWFPIDQNIRFELEINGSWMNVSGIVKWTADYPLLKRVGIFIRNAPEPYVEFLKQLYG